MTPSYPDYDVHRFLPDVAEHKLTVLHDEGLYRHLRFQKPGTGFYWFDLITWPGNLAFKGDMGGFMFARIAGALGVDLDDITLTEQQAADAPLQVAS